MFSVILSQHQNSRILIISVSCVVHHILRVPCVNLPAKNPSLTDTRLTFKKSVVAWRIVCRPGILDRILR